MDNAVKLFDVNLPLLYTLPLLGVELKYLHLSGEFPTPEEEEEEVEQVEGLYEVAITSCLLW